MNEEQPRFGGNEFTVTGRQFVGREQELSLLDEAWGRAHQQDKINIVSLIGQGGEGKSALVLQWQARRARRGWQGARRVFEWSFYSQGTSAQSSASADDFFNAAFAWFDKTQEVPKDSATKGAKLAELIAAQRTLLVLDGTEPLQQPPGGFGGEFKDPAMKALLRGLARHNPGLCIITSRTNITDLAAFEHAGGSCLRHPLHSLDPAAARALLRKLGVLGPDRELDEAAEWFHRHAYDLNLLGNYLAKCTPDRDIRGWQQRFPILREDERIHPIPDAHGKRAGHGVRMLRAYERWLEPPEPENWKRWLPSWLGGFKARRSPALAVLRMLGLFDRPVRSDLLDELRAAPVIPGLTEALVSLPDDEWLLALDQLQELALINRERLSIPAGKAEVEKVSVSAGEVSDDELDELLQNPGLPEHIKKMPRSEVRQLVAGAKADIQNKWAKSADRPRRAVSYALDTHPLLREHFGAGLREKHEAARREGHRRLYAYLCATTPDKPEATLEDLQPLYQAVVHGCQAGLQQEACVKVYRDRIQRGEEFYSIKQLGAFGSGLGAVACFFENPWSRVSPALTEFYQAWMLNEAAFSLRALGRLTGALDPMRVSGEMDVKVERWDGAARSYSNLSELELSLGEVAGAVGDAGQSVTYADRSGDAFLRVVMRTTHADALHQAGRRDEAERLFREAEQMQAENQPAYPLLFSLRGFQYCDLLLAEAERKAGKEEGEGKKEEGLALCRPVAERAAKTLDWLTNHSTNAPPLDIALDHLTLGRAALYAAILESRSGWGEPTQTSSPSPTPEESQRGFLDHAVSGLRHSGYQDYLVRGLLTRAWLRGVTGPRTGPESAQSDLDEAWEIAERGPMALLLADIHLYRARLFYREAQYPWDKHPDGTPRGPKDDLAAARVIIERCGYWRRQEELEDAEAAAKSWPDPMPPVAEGQKVMRKTIVELDLKGYSDVARELEENLSAKVVMHFNDQIQTFVDAGLSAVSLHRADAVMATTGDGAILALDSPSVAHRYAIAVHDACRLHNYEKTVASAKRWFRVGIATGDLALESSAGVKRMAGSVIARAVRLETAGNVGEILVDVATYAGLSDQEKSLYGPEEAIHGKRDEVFAARRCIAVPGIDVDPASPAKSRSVPAALSRWREKLDYLQEQFAVVTSPAQKFELKSQIAEAKKMIEELGG